MPTRWEFPDTPKFAAQNCIYIQAVGGDMLQIKHQNGFVMLTGLHANTPCDPGEVRKEGGTRENDRILDEG